VSTPNRERFRAIARFQRPGDLFTYDGFWGETVRKWIEEGAPPELADLTFRSQFFGHDHRRMLHEIVSWLVILPYSVGDIETFLSLPPIVPRFEPKILAQAVLPVNSSVPTSRAPRQRGRPWA